MTDSVGAKIVAKHGRKRLSGDALRDKIAATAEPVDSDGVTPLEPTWTLWPDPAKGPLQITVQLARVNGTVRMYAMQVQTIMSPSSLAIGKPMALTEFIPLDANLFRDLRPAEIERQVLAEQRAFIDGVLDDPFTSTTPRTSAQLQAAKDAIAATPRAGRGRPRRDDPDLLKAVVIAYTAAGRREPVRAVLAALRTPNSPYRAEFDYTPSTRASKIAKVRRLIQRARELGLLDSPQSQPTESPRPERGKRPAEKASRRSPREES